MRILYVITKSEYGGAQTHIFQLSRYMKQQGHSVAVMSYPGGWLEQEIQNANLKSQNKVKFYKNPYFKNSYNPVLGLKAMAEIRRAVNDFKPDLVSCHSTVAGFWGRMALKNKITTIFTAHGWGFSQGTPFLRKSLVVLAEKLVAKFCDKIICVSEYDKELALKHKIAKPGKLIVIYNGVEINKIQNANLKMQNYSSKVKIVFVGRLSGQKNPELLLQVFSELSQKTQDKTQVSLIGDGSKKEKLQDFIIKNNLKEKVTLLGSLPRENVFKILEQSDIFVLTSNYEGFPRTILEAMSCGLPIIASNVGGVREAVDKEVGFLIERGDKEALKKALIELIENPDLRKRMGQNARKRAEKEFSLEKMLEKTSEVYRSI